MFFKIQDSKFPTGTVAALFFSLSSNLAESSCCCLGYGVACGKSN